MSSDTPPRTQERRRARGLSAIVWLAGSGLVTALMLLWVFYHDAVEQAFNWVPGWIFPLTMALLVLVVAGIIVRALIWQRHPRLALATQWVSLALTALSGQLPDASHRGPVGGLPDDGRFQPW